VDSDYEISVGDDDIYVDYVDDEEETDRRLTQPTL
jgi:hypothetical protein